MRDIRGRQIRAGCLIQQVFRPSSITPARAIVGGFDVSRGNIYTVRETHVRMMEEWFLRYEGRVIDGERNLDANEYESPWEDWYMPNDRTSFSWLILDDLLEDSFIRLWQ